MTLDTIPTPVATPNYGGVRKVTDLCVWHCTAGGSARGALDWIARPKSFAGYHFIIDRDGSVFASTPLARIAYHAGISDWPVPVSGVNPRTSVNSRSVGISFANWNVGVDEKNHDRITPQQITAALNLAPLLAVRYPALRSVSAHVRHRDVAPGRKTDPLQAVLDWAAFTSQLAKALT